VAQGVVPEFKPQFRGEKKATSIAMWTGHL
jgi:hypothetical protein